ncbi:MAG: DUF1801 domain-containing protein [Octadecabacter sp.]
MDETLKSSILDAVVGLARDLRPNVHIGAKYGGTIFVTDPDAPETVGLVGGVFAYKDHVSVEFSHGVGFHDPNGLLAGKGKARRHVKLRSLGDIDAMNVAGFLTQAFA